LPLHSQKVREFSTLGDLPALQSLKVTRANREGSHTPYSDGVMQADWMPVPHPYLFFAFLFGLIEMLIVSRPGNSPFFL
jgi:hypothetical protein